MAGRQRKGYITCTGVLSILGMVSFVTCADTCQSNLLTLRDYQYRDIIFNPSDPDNWENICDTATIVTDAWYRMSPSDNQRMSEKCPKIGSCGTVYPIWLGGPHPTDDNIKEMKVYMNFRDNCYYWDPDSDNTVLVKRCPAASGGYFYIYRIPDPPFCDSGYCTQNVSSSTTRTILTTTTTTPTTTTRIPTRTTTTPTTTTATTTTTRTAPTRTTTTPTTTTATTTTTRTTPTTTTTTTTATTTTTTTTTTTSSCSGIKDPTRPGECLSRHPLIGGRPTIEGPYLEDDQPAIYCRIPYTGYDVMSRERFYVRFMIGEYSAEEIETGKDQLRVKLPQGALIGRMGNVVSCKVTSAWSFRSYDRQPYLTSSNNYFLGIQVRNNRLDVREADDQPITIWPYATLPVTCPTPTPRCSVSLRLVPESDELKSAFVCRYSISTANWNDTTRTAKGHNPLVLKARTSPLYSGKTKSFRIRFLKQRLEPGHIWNGYTMAPITINYYDSPFGLCKVELDTYVTTFDQRQYLFPGKGELWVLRSSAKRIYEVQIRTMTSKRCFGDHPCVCAVAVREGNEVAILDTCNDYVSGDVILPRTAIYRYRTIGGKGLKVTRDGPGKRFSFNLPSGAHVVADVKSYGLDLFVHTTSEDYGKTSGLCGSYDGNPGNDPNPNTMSDVSTFRIRRLQSYFDKNPDQRPVDPVPDHFCSCSKADTISCGSEELIDPASYTGSPGVNQVGPPGADVDVLVKIDKLSGSADDAEDPEAAFREGDKRLEWSYHFDYGIDYTPQTPRTAWPTPSGIREHEARTKCVTTLSKLPFYPKCKNTVGIDDEEVLTKCVSAIQRIDDLDIAALTLSSYEHQCFFDASSQEKLRQKTPDGSMGLPDQAIFTGMCPSNCNGRGMCSGQRCTCNPGYRASDCSLPVNQRPTIHSVIGRLTCDVRERPCRQVAFLVTNATDESSLTCRMTFVDVNGKRGKSYETKGTLRTWTEVVCELPESPLLTNENDGENHVIGARHYWSVEISNDGESYSKSDVGNLMVWDSKCLSCSSENQCFVKRGTCLIDNRCYARNEGDPTTAFCSQCDPSVSTTTFTPVLNNNPPVLQGPFTIYKLRYDEYNSYLLATDPDGQTEFSYSMDSSLRVSGISLTSRGILHVSNEVQRDVSVRVKVTDVCGSSDAQVFRIKTLDCGCVASSSCTEQPFRIKSHRYTCECVTGSCSARETENCLSPACTDGILCQPSLYRSGYDCQCRTPARESRCSIDGLRVWSEWQDWSACSKSCDYGLRQRVRTCLGCVTPDPEVQLCNRQPCSELKQEKTKGVIVKVQVASNKKVEQVLTKQYDVLDIIRQSINIKCAKQATSCCQKDVWINPLSSYNFVSPKDIWLASGYPQVNWNENWLSLKILATISNSAYQQYCDSSSRRKRAASSSTHYIPGDIIKEAVTESIRNLEQDIGFHVIEVYKVAEPPQRSWILYAAVAAGLVVITMVVAVVICVVYKKRQNERRRKRKQKYVRRVQERNNLPEHGEISEQPGYTSLQGGRSRHGSAIRNSNHVYEEPDTNYQRLGDSRSGMADSHYESIRQ